MLRTENNCAGKKGDGGKASKVDICKLKKGGGAENEADMWNLGSQNTTIADE